MIYLILLYFALLGWLGVSSAAQPALFASISDLTTTDDEFAPSRWNVNLIESGTISASYSAVNNGLANLVSLRIC